MVRSFVHQQTQKARHGQVSKSLYPDLYHPHPRITFGTNPFRDLHVCRTPRDTPLFLFLAIFYQMISSRGVSLSNRSIPLSYTTADEQSHTQDSSILGCSCSGKPWVAKASSSSLYWRRNKEKMKFGQFEAPFLHSRSR